MSTCSRVLMYCMRVLLSLLGGVSVACAAAPSAPQRIEAARKTAAHAAACLATQPFHWEIGNAQGVLAAGQVGRNTPDAQTEMAYASASKWIYGAYVAERRQGVLNARDLAFLNFTSGYTRFRICLRGDTVQSCQARLLNGRGLPDDATKGLFSYGGGHMQQSAIEMGLGSLDNEGLAKAIRQGLHALGSTWRFDYKQPQPAGGGAGTAADYGRFLRGILAGELKMGALLGTHPVCTNPSVCNDAIKSPIPDSERWHYAVGHWVEDDPGVGDGAFSSPGAFGFYPWIDAGKQFYGMLARESHQGLRGGEESEKPGVQSVYCGRLIRAAWLSGVAKP